jgi:Flp pilus assembly pilin Flp
MMLSFSSLRFGKGQGLVEYAIILALVVIVVIAVVEILGPKLGNTFSTINNSLDTASAAPAGWTYAIGEYNNFNLPAGTYEVQYGANGVYVSQIFTGPAVISCNNSTFGDPLVGIVKSCSYR